MNRIKGYYSEDEEKEEEEEEERDAPSWFLSLISLLILGEIAVWIVVAFYLLLCNRG